MVNFKNLEIKIRLVKYLPFYKIRKKLRTDLLVNKIVSLYVSNGDYGEAIKYYEYLLYKKDRKEYIFPLFNFLIMSKEFKKLGCLMEQYSNSSFEDFDFTYISDKLNNSVRKVDMVDYVVSYIREKNATPVLA